MLKQKKNCRNSPGFGFTFAVLVITSSQRQRLNSESENEILAENFEALMHHKYTLAQLQHAMTRTSHCVLSHGFLSQRTGSTLIEIAFDHRILRPENTHSLSI